MSELRVDNIVSQDGTAAPIYSRGLNIPSGQTLTNNGDYVVGGATSMSGNMSVSGVSTFASPVTFSQGATIDGNITLQGTLNAISGANLYNPTGIITTGTLDVSGATSFGDITGTISNLVVGAGASIVGVTTAASFEQADGAKVATTGKAIAMSMVFGG